MELLYEVLSVVCGCALVYGCALLFLGDIEGNEYTPTMKFGLTMTFAMFGWQIAVVGASNGGAPFGASASFLPWHFWSLLISAVLVGIYLAMAFLIRLGFRFIGVDEEE